MYLEHVVLTSDLLFLRIVSRDPSMLRDCVVRMADLDCRGVKLTLRAGKQPRVCW